MKTIADAAKAVLIRTDNDGVGSGDCILLDEILIEAEKQGCLKKPISRFANLRHQRVLNSLESQRGKQLFEKRKDRYDGTRQFYLKK